MIGYKAIELKNGILRSKGFFNGRGDIFELGVPKKPVHVEDNVAFSETGFSFCEKMEQVQWHEKYIVPEKVKGNSDMRLFRVKSRGRTVGEGSHIKAESITVLEEVTHDEIVRYYEDHPERLPEDISEDDWRAYCALNIENYRRIIDKEEIEQIIARSCLRLRKRNFCQQKSEPYSLERCKLCEGKDWGGGIRDNYPDYWYLECRRKLFTRCKLEDIKEFMLLKEYPIERENLEWLSEWMNSCKRS